MRFFVRFADLQSLGGSFRMAVSIRLKYGILRRVFDKHIDKYEYVTFLIKNKKASILLAFSVAPSEGLEPSTP